MRTSFPPPRSSYSPKFVTGPTRLVFLDIDGVLNSAALLLSRLGQQAKPISRSERRTISKTLPYYRFGPQDYSASRIILSDLRKLDRLAMARLNRLLEETQALVVVSSTWRKMLDVPGLQLLLQAKGFTGDIIGRTPELGQPRGLEIQAWLEASEIEVTSFVILDDDSDMEHLKDRLVKTTWAAGLQDEHVDAAREILLRQPV